MLRDLGTDLQLLGKKCEGYFGDPTGYEESLFATKENSYVVIGQGGHESAYSQLQIFQVNKTEARNWLTDLLGKDQALKRIPVASRKASKTAKAPTAKKATANKKSSSKK